MFTPAETDLLLQLIAVERGEQLNTARYYRSVAGTDHPEVGRASRRLAELTTLEQKLRPAKAAA